MKIKYVPQMSDVQYKIVDEVIYIKINNKVKKVDFSNLEDGRLESSISDIREVVKENGELTVTLIQPLDGDGNELPAIVDFEVDEYEEADFEWKTKEEIEREESKLSESDMVSLAILELAIEIERLKGDK